MMASFNLRRVFLPIAVGSLRLLIALRKSRFVTFSTFTLSRFQLEDAPKRWPVCRIGRLATLLIASMLAIGSTPEPARRRPMGHR